jgi:hypothetical protein
VEDRKAFHQLLELGPIGLVRIDVHVFLPPQEIFVVVVSAILAESLGIRFVRA